ncbi:MAG: hypothetical protein HS108_15255 [Planctomycetes bacterium]|nr:hypothetical protein [Planctomycetota bacterium]MCL4731580.1 hypothetical protein [Planctomycetota bacterium]
MRRALLLALVCLLPAGCGYTWTARQDGLPSRTLRLETIENRLFPNRPGYEHDLGRRLKDEIALDRRLVPTDGRADVVMQVALTRFSEPNLVDDVRTGNPAEVQLRASVVVVVRGKGVPGNEARRTISVSNSYAPALGEPREAGMTRLWRDLARRILDFAADTEWSGE